MVTIDRNTDQRYIGDGAHVTYDATKAGEWLAGPDPSGIGETIAETYDVDGGWPHQGAGFKLDSVISLTDAAIYQKVIGLCDLIATVGYERTCDSSGVLDGARLIVTTTTDLTLAGDAVWASDLTNDEFGARGALNALWNTAWEIHYLLVKLHEWPRKQGQ